MEAEALLVGTWKNIEELEECLNLEELNAILNASYKLRREDQRFYALFKGVDLDEGAKEDAQEAFDRVQRRAQARLRGVAEEDIERAQDSDLFGLDFEVED